MNVTGVNVESVLRIGQLVKLQLSVNGPLRPFYAGGEDDLRVCSSHVQDLLHNDIVVDWPTERAVHLPIEAGQRIALMTSSDKGWVVLDSHIVAKTLHPLPLLSIARDGRWSHSQFRNNVRLTTTVHPRETILVSSEKNKIENVCTGDGNRGTGPNEGMDEIKGERIEAVIRDLSAGGIRLASPTQLDRGSVIKITFPLGYGQPGVAALATVVWVGEDESVTKYGHEAGCNFVNLGMKEQDSIAKFIFAKQVELRRRGLV